MALFSLTVRSTVCSHFLLNGLHVTKTFQNAVAFLHSTTRWSHQHHKAQPSSCDRLIKINIPQHSLSCVRTNDGFFQVKARSFSADTYNKYFSPDVAPIGYAQNVLESIHSVTGLPWWASILVTTVLLRSLVTLPLTIYSMHIIARVEQLQPEIAKLSQELRREVAVAVKTFGWDAKTARFKYNTTMRKLIRELYIRDNCHPAKSSLVLWFQIPMWISVSFALRNMSGAIPNNTSNAPILCPDLQAEGTLWFPDLTAPDVTWILPVILGLANFINIEMHSLLSQKASKFQQSLIWIMRVFSILMVPIGAVVPSCMCYYWVCSSLFGVAQNLMLKVPTIRRLVHLPQTPSESSTPFQDMYSAALKKYFRKQ